MKKVSKCPQAQFCKPYNYLRRPIKSNINLNNNTMETLEDQIITLEKKILGKFMSQEKKIKELKHVLSFRSSELKQARNRAWEISEAMEEGIEEGMDAESCWARACAIADGEDTYSTMSPFDDEKSVDEF